MENRKVVTLIAQDLIGQPPRKRIRRQYVSLQTRLLTLCQDRVAKQICVYCCHNQPKVGNDFFELISSSDAAEKELSSKSKIVFL